MKYAAKKYKDYINNTYKLTPNHRIHPTWIFIMSKCKLKNGYNILYVLYTNRLVGL